MYCFRFTEEEEEEYSTSIKVEGWFTPKSKSNEGYKKIIGIFHKSIKQLTYDASKFIGYDDYLVNLDMKASGIRFEKPSYVCIDIVLSGDKDYDKDVYLSLLDTHLKHNKFFRFYRNKKDVR